MSQEQTDCEHDDASNSVSIDVNNTPDTILGSPFPGEKVAGEFDITGMAYFKPNPQGYDGEVHIYVDGSKRFCQSYKGSPAKFSYRLDAGTMSNGQHTFSITVVAANGTVGGGALFKFFVDNTPEIDLTTPYPNEEVEGEFDIAGNVYFKPNSAGAEGKIHIYLDGSKRSSKSYEGTTAEFSYNTENPDTKLNAGKMTNGQHTVTIRAVAANGTTSEKTVKFNVDNTPEITISTPSPNEKILGKFDFTGSVSFKDGCGSFTTTKVGRLL